MSGAAARNIVWAHIGMHLGYCEARSVSQMNSAPIDARLVLVETLVGLSALDLPFSDLYLDRAEALLAAVLPREEYTVLSRENRILSDLATQLRRVAERGDWQAVHSVAQQAAGIQQHAADHQRLLGLCEAVYGPRVLHADAAALALNGIAVHAPGDLHPLREDCLERLRIALAHDGEGADLYRARMAHFDALALRVTCGEQPVNEVADLQQRILRAAERRDFQAADRLSTAILDALSRNGVHGRPAVRAALEASSTGSASFSDATVERARAVGLSLVALDAERALGRYLAASAGAPTSADPPPIMSNTLRETLDLLASRPFVTSGGTPYVPAFDAETLLVETFSETALETRTGVLDALALRTRRGLSRLTIEDAIRRHTARLCAELGLDPAAYVVTLVPFDAYLRLAPPLGWGRQRVWTHFDGYQLNQALHLRALVGGDIRYGGPEDLCSVGRDYESERLVARFAIMRRERARGLPT